jgi:trehalose/maltose transport system substrate-binding protein
VSKSTCSLVLLVVLTAGGCETRSAPAGPVTITFTDGAWWDATSRRRRTDEIRQFTQETGIHVEQIMSTGDAAMQLALWRGLLEKGTRGADVYGFDATWPGMFADEFIDLRPYVPASEISVHFAPLIANSTVGGKLVSLPRAAMVPLLWYRTDLLRDYGYRAPPGTWDELERMAARIQAGERAKGRDDFWGFVWAGVRAEPLATIALEWQASEGGGTILDNGAITVNNASALSSWQRAARWVGTLSPPSVVEYFEPDASNVWRAGHAAFMRSWPLEFAFDARGSVPDEDVGVAPLPKGAVRRAATLGRYSFGVSRRSPHPREAAMFVRFLSRRDVQLTRALAFHVPPSIPDLYDEPRVVRANPHFAAIRETLIDGVVVRPSAAAGKAYPEVSRAYVDAVHAVLTREKGAAEAAADLEDVLRRVTGLEPPLRK